MKSILVFVFASLFTPCWLTAVANLLLVPQEYNTIQSGLSAAAAGDTVLVAAGTYYENIHFPALEVTLLSAAGPAVTIIDGNSDTHTVLFDQDQTGSTLLQGFTICNGSALLDESRFGGGIYCNRAAPTIRDNLITGNQAFLGGGICCYQSSATILNNTISDNVASRGGGFYAFDSQPLLSGNIFDSNQCEGNGAGGGIALEFTHATVERNFIRNNSALPGGGLICRFDSSSVRGNTIVANSAAAGGGILCRYSNSLLERNIVSSNLGTASGMASRMSLPRLSCNDIWGNDGGDYWEGEDLGGNFSLNPLFCDLTGGDLRLQQESPCWTVDCGIIGASQQNCNGESTPQSTSQPAVTELRPNYPNPFNPVTTLEFHLPAPQSVRLEVWDLRGRLVALLAEGPYSSGLHRVRFEAHHLASGIYLYRLQCAGTTIERRMLLIK
ncbi:MAG: right-handed parallel beta-helix repeat-containing protein [Candidatus Delongbacteria bacterium]|nr:right-handed parallel beta-helix repeat-containing protein [Candidatus Delongbacteria bacterium]